MLINYNSKEVDLCARTMRAEALNDGELAMLMVGNVIVNRAIIECYNFKNVRTITDVIYQKNQFSSVNSSLFFQRANSKEKALAKRVLNGEYFHPATNALFFYSPKKSASCKDTWYDENFCGQYKSHCFYEPSDISCMRIH